MLRSRQIFGKYRIERRLAEGGFAEVYRAYDQIEGIRVALKVPHRSHVNPEMLESFRNEVRLASALDHPNILPIKNAQFIDRQFVVAYPLGENTLAGSARRLMSVKPSSGCRENLYCSRADLMLVRFPHTSPKRKRGNTSGASPALRVSVKSGRKQCR